MSDRLPACIFNGKSCCFCHETIEEAPVFKCDITHKTRNWMNVMEPCDALNYLPKEYTGVWGDNPLKIFFLGACGSGKTTAAVYLGQQYLMGEQSEGTRLRTACAVLGLKRDRINLQLLGEGIRKMIGVTCWLDVLLKEMDSRFPATIDDIRHPEDAEKLKSLGWTSIRIDCPKNTRIERLKLRRREGEELDLSAIDAPSEHLLDDYQADYTVDNSGTLDKLHRQLDDIMRELRGDRHE
jgi:adenylate kinase family enzyme